LVEPLTPPILLLLSVSPGTSIEYKSSSFVSSIAIPF
jgi:hypothetical protein